MANIKSAKKRIDTIKRQREENKLVKSTLATSIKKFKKALASEDITSAEALLKETISLIDKAESKNVLHKNNASRKVSRLSAALSNAKSKVQTEVKEEAKEEAPKAEVKKTRKTTAKKETK